MWRGRLVTASVTMDEPTMAHDRLSTLPDRFLWKNRYKPSRRTL